MVQGYDAFATYSAEQAIELCRDGCPDAVITDVVMGPMNRVRLAVHPLQTFPECKVILVSGNVLTDCRLLDSNSDAGG